MSDITNIETISYFKELLTIIAIIIGGSWTLFWHFSMKKSKKSLLELQTIKHQLDIHPSLSIDIQNNFKKVNNEYLIFTTVEIKNNGSQNTSIYFPKIPLSLSRINLVVNNSICEQNLEEIYYSYWDSTESIYSHLAIRKLANWKLNFVTKVSKPGLYVCNFFAEMNKNDQKFVETLFSNNHNNYVENENLESTLNWTNHSYIYVDEKNKNFG